jgi:uncharacterized membrane protein YukC
LSWTALTLIIITLIAAGVFAYNYFFKSKKEEDGEEKL